MHFSILILGASLVSAQYGGRQYGPDRDQLDYLKHLNGVSPSDQNQDHHQNGNYNYGGNIDGDYDEEDPADEEHGGDQNDNPSPHAQPTPPASLTHSTFVVRPSPISIVSPHAQDPAPGYTYSYPNPKASQTPVAHPKGPSSPSLPVSKTPPAQAPPTQASAPQPHQKASAHHAPVQVPSSDFKEPQAAPVDRSNESQQVLPPKEQGAGLGPDAVSLPDDVPAGKSGGVAPIDPMKPGSNVAPVLFSKTDFGKDEGNTFCTGLCYANESDAQCAKPYSLPVYKSAKGCYMCCFASDF